MILIRVRRWQNPLIYIWVYIFTEGKEIVENSFSHTKIHARLSTHFWTTPTQIAASHTHTHRLATHFKGINHTEIPRNFR